MHMWLACTISYNLKSENSKKREQACSIKTNRLHQIDWPSDEIEEKKDTDTAPLPKVHVGFPKHLIAAMQCNATCARL